MLSRHYNRKIEIWRKDFVTNEFAGLVETDVLVKSIWAKIITNAGHKFINFGIQEFKSPVIFSVRGRKNDIDYTENYHIRYKGAQYFIKGIQDIILDEQEKLIYTDSE